MSVSECLGADDLRRQNARASAYQCFAASQSAQIGAWCPHWREHLAALDHLRQGIHLRSYAQKNPKQEYKREAFQLFEALLNTVKSEVTKITMLIQVRTQDDAEATDKPQEVSNVQYQHADFEEALANPQGDYTEEQRAQMAGGTPIVREGIKVGRNDPCPCGSGKKYKQCHGVLN